MKQHLYLISKINYLIILIYLLILFFLLLAYLSLTFFF